MGNLAKGYVKLFRSITDNFLWTDKPFAFGQAWIDLILMVNHEDRDIIFNKRLLHISRGSVVTSSRKLAERWGWKRDKVLYFLRTLQSQGMISVKSDSQKTVITLGNYVLYQGSGKSISDTLPTRKGTREGTRKGTREGHKQYTKNTLGRNEEERARADVLRDTASLPEEEHGKPLPDDFWDDPDKYPEIWSEGSGNV